MSDPGLRRVRSLDGQISITQKVGAYICEYYIIVDSIGFLGEAGSAALAHLVSLLCFRSQVFNSDNNTFLSVHFIKCFPSDNVSARESPPMDVEKDHDHVEDDDLTDGTPGAKNTGILVQKQNL